MGLDRERACSAGASHHTCSIENGRGWLHLWLLFFFALKRAVMVAVVAVVFCVVKIADGLRAGKQLQAFQAELLVCTCWLGTCSRSAACASEPERISECFSDEPQVCLSKLCVEPASKCT